MRFLSLVGILALIGFLWLCWELVEPAFQMPGYMDQ